MSLGNNNVNKCKQFAFDLNVVAVDDANYDSPDNSDLCSICLKFLVNNNDDRRTLVTLKCDHKFHFDCLGTTFNATSLMQCPKCMQIEPGQWQYATSLQNPNSIAEEDETIPEYSIEMTMGMELCPIKVLAQHNSSGNTNSVDHAISSNEPPEHIGSQECLYIEYSFAIPQSSSAGVAQNFNFSSQLTTGAEQVPDSIQSNRRIFWSSEPGVMRGRHYMAHPYLDHRRIPDSFGLNPVNDDGSRREEADPFLELAEQFQMERDQLYIMIGGHQNGNQGGSSGGGNGDGNGISGGGEN